MIRCMLNNNASCSSSTYARRTCASAARVVNSASGRSTPTPPPLTHRSTARCELRAARPFHTRALQSPGSNTSAQTGHALAAARSSAGAACVRGGAEVLWAPSAVGCPPPLPLLLRGGHGTLGPSWAWGPRRGSTLLLAGAHRCRRSAMEALSGGSGVPRCRHHWGTRCQRRLCGAPRGAVDRGRPAGVKGQIVYGRPSGAWSRTPVTRLLASRRGWAGRGVTPPPLHAVLPSKCARLGGASPPRFTRDSLQALARSDSSAVQGP